MAFNPIVIIPARLAAQRLPNKPLADIAGKSMILHMVELAEKASVGPVVVACCGREIADVLEAHGKRVVTTDPTLLSGTDRVYAALKQIDPAGTHDIVINLQGDMPLFPPQGIVSSLFPLDDMQADIATLAVPIASGDDITNPSTVKIAMTAIGPDSFRAHYFSRAPIPHQSPVYYHHLGIYAYRREALERFVALPPSPLETAERLEQLRALENGLKIHVGLIDSIPQSVDTPEDLEKVRAFFAS